VQAFPARPITMIVSFPAAGPAEMTRAKKSFHILVAQRFYVHE
jgi:hypothetical protein